MSTTDDFGPPAGPPFLATAALRQRLDLLGHLLEFGHQIVLVQGAPGCGRSRLLEALCAHYRANWRIIPCVGEAVASAPALLDALAAALEMSELNPGVEDLRGRMAEIELGGQFCILTLDDGEHLDEAARALLFALASGENQRGDLRVVVTGEVDDGFAEALQAAAPDGAVIHVVDVPPMEVEELKTLALSALSAEGGDAALDLSLDIDELAVDAQGNPGRLLASLRAPALPPISPGRRSAAPSATGADRLGNLTDGLRGLNLRKYAAVLAALAFVLVAVAVGVLLVGQHSRDSQPGAVEITLPPPTPAPAMQATSAEEPPTAPPATAAEATLETVAENGTPALEPDERAAGRHETSAATEPAPAAPTAAGAEVPVASSALPGDTTVARAPAADGEPTSSEVPRLVAPAAPLPKAAPRETPKPRPAAGKPARPVAPARPAAAAATGATDPWLRQQKPGSYVVQLFGSRERGAAQRFIGQQGLKGKANVVETRLEGAPWYVVVTGPYATRVAASAAIRAMAPALQKQKPWPRAIASLK